MKLSLKNLQNLTHLPMVAATLFFAQCAIAAGTDPGGTAAGVSVANQATLDYEIGGVGQTQILSDNDGNPANGANPTTFVVDRKLDGQVTEAGAAYNSSTTTTVVPGLAQGGGSTGAVLAYTITNEGNEIQDFSLAAGPTTFDPHGGADNFDATNVNVFVDANDDGIYDPAVDTGTFVDELDYFGNPGGNPSSVVVFVVADIPATRANGDVAAYVLTAQVAEGGSAGTPGADITSDDSAVADNPAVVQDVFADAENTNNGSDGLSDGVHSAEDAFIISTPTLTVAKSSVVISDPFTCPSGTCAPGDNPKAIPGAVIEYTISVVNAPGSPAASNLSVSDDLTTEILGGGGTESIDFLPGEYGGAGADIELTNIVGGVPAVTNLGASAGDGDAGQFVANIVSVTIANLAGGDTAEVRFRVEIQ